MPSTATTTSPLYIIPHTLLPPLLFLPFFLPPFPGRNVLFAALVAGTSAACNLSAWPPAAGPDRAMRYGMAGSWVFVLPVLEKLLLHASPETEFYRLSDAAAAAGGGEGEEGARPPPPPKDWTWDKARWAAGLACSPRGVGWSHGRGRKRPAARRGASSGGRWAYVARQVLGAVAAYLAVDACVYLARGVPMPAAWSWDPAVLARVACLEVLLGVTVYATWAVGMCIPSAVAVGAGISRVEDWPPLFGNIAEATTVGAFWGRYWHDLIKQVKSTYLPFSNPRNPKELSRSLTQVCHHKNQPCLSISHRLNALLRIPDRTPPAYAVHLLTAFAISGWFHVQSASVVAEGYIPVSEIARCMALFFAGQAAIVTLEAAVIKRLAGSAKAPGPGSRWARVLGYAWTGGWLMWSGWWFVKVYDAIGVLEWEMPFPVVSKIAAHFGF